MKSLKMLDLFAGIGGASLAASRLGIETTQFVEINPDAQAILRQHFPEIPIHADIRNYQVNEHFSHQHAKRTSAPEPFDIIWCSFPCTGTSDAGKREGLSHPDSALWWESWRVINQARPRFMVIEQPSGVRHRGGHLILSSLTEIGYMGEWTCIRADDLGAMHKRERLFIVSYPHQLQRQLRSATRWSDQMREMVQAARADTTWLSIKRTRNGKAHGVPQGMAVPTKTKGRITARRLAGTAVTPAQASIPLQRVLYLNGLLEMAEGESP